MFYDYKMSPNFIGRFKKAKGYFEQKDQARRDFSKRWYNLRSNTSLERFNTDQWNNAFDAINDLAKADQEEKKQLNLIIKEID
jgi:DNA mismatch repair ATPase MutS